MTTDSTTDGVTEERRGSLRVVLVDDHAVVRRGLADLLASTADIDVVGTAGDGDEAMAVVEETRPDVVLMDLQMPRTDGVEATRRLLASGAETQVLVLTSYSDSERILAALDAGAVGYLLKDADPDALSLHVRAVAEGGTAWGVGPPAPPSPQLPYLTETQFPDTWSGDNP
jgi:DNA-binding NarL/FixJ family response regulator